MRTKTRRGATVAGLAVMAMAGGVLAAPAATAELPGCTLRAEAPMEFDGFLTGMAFRNGCAEVRTVVFRLREDVASGPDVTVLQSTRFGVVNGAFLLRWDCPAGLRGTFYTQLLTTAGETASSPKRQVFCR